MTDKYLEMTKKGIQFIKSYSGKILGFLTAFFAVISTSVKRSEKKAKKHIKFIKIKNTLEVISNVILIVAGVIAIIFTVFEFLKSKDN